MGFKLDIQLRTNAQVTFARCAASGGIHNQFSCCRAFQFEVTIRRCYGRKLLWRDFELHFTWQLKQKGLKFGGGLCGHSGFYAAQLRFYSRLLLESGLQKVSTPVAIAPATARSADCSGQIVAQASVSNPCCQR